MSGLSAGLHAVARLTVTEADTAAALGSGDVPVLGTPRIVALCESASVEAVARHLDPGDTTVGVLVDIQHLAPSPVGASVEASATLTMVRGRRLSFDVEVTDATQEVARGVIIRTIVDRERFLDTVRGA